jgi:hypothetical protein
MAATAAVGGGNGTSGLLHGSTAPDSYWSPSYLGQAGSGGLSGSSSGASPLSSAAASGSSAAPAGRYESNRHTNCKTSLQAQRMFDHANCSVAIASRCNCKPLGVCTVACGPPAMQSQNASSVNEQAAQHALLML